MERKAALTRTTKETDISLSLNLDGAGEGKIELNCNYTKRQIDILKAGGLLAYTKGE